MGYSRFSAILLTFLMTQVSLHFGSAGADVVVYDWRLTPVWAAFDGVFVDTLGVNDKPGNEAVIDIEFGQEIEVRVTNELSEATCLHWHGMKQLGTQEMDGVSGFTQCFIEPNNTAVYRFTPDKSGTFWWHSHHKAQYAYGLRGPLIVHPPAKDLRSCEKDIDEEYTIQLADIYHAPPPPGPALWDSIVINNLGCFNCSAAAMNNFTDCEPDQPLSTFHFQGGKKYLLRLINVAAMAPFEFSIDDHDFRVIAADAEPVVPTQLINSLFINVGQRYDIIVETKNDTQGVDSFWMRAKGLSGLPWMARTAESGSPGFNDEGFAIVRYDSTSTSEPTTDQRTETVTVAEFDFAPATPAVLPTTPSDRSIVEFNISQEGGVISLDGGDYHSIVIPDEPPLLTIASGLSTSQLPATANARAIEYGKHIEVVIVNDMNEQHPFHLHSHIPWVIGSGQASIEDIQTNNLPPSKLEGPMLRDVYTVPPCNTDDTNSCLNVGYLILRFTADNPGVWMMHCHIDWHMNIGMAMVFVEAAKVLFLDGIRGAAVIFVVTQHCGYMHDIFMGAVGVDAFFVLSSFLLTMIFMKKSIKLLAEGASYRKWAYTLADYFSKRFFRVYPLFTLLSIALWLMPFEYKHQFYKVSKPEDFNLFLTLTFHPEHRHYLMWTLPLEISYYFVLPAFVLSVLKTGRFWWMAFIPLYVWVVHEGLYTTRDNYYRQPLTKHLPTFIAGSMAAVIFVKLEAWMKTTGFKFQTLHTVALRVVEAVLIAAYLSVVFRGLFFNWLDASLPPATHYIMPFTSVKLSLLIVIEMVHPSTVSLIFEWVVFRYLGKISFSVYLLHVFVIYIKPISSQPSYYDRTFSFFGLVILLATASYHLVEYPSQLLAQRISRKFTMLASFDHQKLVEESDTDGEKHTGDTDIEAGRPDKDSSHLRLLSKIRGRKEGSERLPNPATSSA
ncbi:hypothetical protein G195_005916 [Phytophthora kernoviae 00238/432]|uniref:Uncharacterized protein n=1 Tax=Phytophthora kernoviae 00238/432 TaxID=1284355 RepID=A0A8J4WET3_9STRA|nr:hypothetical protein G195_005916 [Phytophthora kernoviae 00238/432]